MPVTIQDDFWESAQAMPEKQRAPFLYAVIRYGFTGEAPKGSPAWLPTFITVRKRIDMSNAKSDKFRKLAHARWDKRAQSTEDTEADPVEDANAYATEDACAYAEGDAYAYASACQIAHAESEIESESEDKGGNPPISPLAQNMRESMRAPDDGPPEDTFPWRCLDALNRVLGRTYSTMPADCWDTLHRFEAVYDVGDVERMVAYKRDEWRSTKFARALTPNTLFSPRHFEQYMGQAMEAKEVNESYDDYDRD